MYSGTVVKGSKHKGTYSKYKVQRQALEERKVPVGCSIRKGKDWGMRNTAERCREDKENTEIIKIMVADDHPFIRQALKILLEAEPDMKIIGEANNGAEAVELAVKLQPDVAIMDIGMPVMNGLEATRQIKQKCPNVSILVLTVFTDNQHVIGILNAGAAGYLTKEVFGDDVIRGIRAIMAGEAVLTPSILQQILKSVPPQPMEKNPAPTIAKNLTPRDLVILKLIASGMCNKDVAAELNINVRTVKANMTAIFNKLGVSSRTEAVVTGLRYGLLSISDLG
jgi:NarL family two-component system response regulator LiaR